MENKFKLKQRLNVDGLTLGCRLRRKVFHGNFVTFGQKGIYASSRLVTATKQDSYKVGYNQTRISGSRKLKMISICISVTLFHSLLFL